MILCNVLSFHAQVDWFFSSWDEDVNVPLAEENEPISSINSELLAKAENLSKRKFSSVPMVCLDFFMKTLVSAR